MTQDTNAVGDKVSARRPVRFEQIRDLETARYHKEEEWCSGVRCALCLSAKYYLLSIRIS